VQPRWTLGPASISRAPGECCFVDGEDAQANYVQSHIFGTKPKEVASQLDDKDEESMHAVKDGMEVHDTVTAQGDESIMLSEDEGSVQRVVHSPTAVNRADENIMLSEVTETVISERALTMHGNASDDHLKKGGMDQMTSSSTVTKASEVPKRETSQFAEVLDNSDDGEVEVEEDELGEGWYWEGGGAGGRRGRGALRAGASGRGGCQRGCTEALQ